jgi:hypothetical protein
MHRTRKCYNSNFIVMTKPYQDLKSTCFDLVPWIRIWNQISPNLVSWIRIWNQIFFKLVPWIRTWNKISFNLVPWIRIWNQISINLVPWSRIWNQISFSLVPLIRIISRSPLTWFHFGSESGTRSPLNSMAQDLEPDIL